MSEKDGIDRRKFLAVAGALSMGLAGCVEESDDGSDDEAVEPPERTFTLDELDHDEHRYMVESLEFQMGQRDEPPTDVPEPDSDYWTFVMEAHEYLVAQKN